MKTSRDEIEPFTTLDGSEIRELMHPAHHCCRNLSVAEAVVAPGAETASHRHTVTEEVYFFLAGEGKMTLGTERFPVREGDTVCISPGLPHRVENTGSNPLRILCSCAPAYSHEDTSLLDETE